MLRPELDDQVRPHGFTLRHFPQRFALSTLRRSRGVYGAVALVVAVAVIAVLAFVVLPGDDAPPRPKDGRYSNSRLRYEFQYPTDWADIGDKVRFVVPETAKVLDHIVVGTFEEEAGLLNGAQLSVVELTHEVSDADREKALQALDDLFQQQAATVRGRLLPPDWVELGGLKARRFVIEFVWTTGDQVASAQVTTFFGDRQYTVNCQGRASTFDAKVVPGCEQVLETFRFK